MVYNPIALTRFISMIIVESDHKENFKSAAWGEIEKLQDSSKE
jgi:hypothetical protein